MLGVGSLLKFIWKLVFSHFCSFGLNPFNRTPKTCLRRYNASFIPANTVMPTCFCHSLQIFPLLYSRSNMPVCKDSFKSFKLKWHSPCYHQTEAQLLHDSRFPLGLQNCWLAVPQRTLGLAGLCSLRSLVPGGDRAPGAGRHLTW